MMNQIRDILLAEDSPNDAELTLLALEENKLSNRVVVARDGAEALDYLYRKGKYTDRAPGNPAVVLLDLKMPKVDGLEVLRIIRSTESLQALPVVLLTSSSEESDLIESYKLGVNSYIVKPIDFSTLSAVVAQLGYYWMAINRAPRRAG